MAKMLLIFVITQTLRVAVELNLMAVLMDATTLVYGVAVVPQVYSGLEALVIAVVVEEADTMAVSPNCFSRLPDDCKNFISLISSFINILRWRW